MMFGDEEGIVVSLRPFPLHGMTWWDVVVQFDDGRTEEARLGAEGVPVGLQQDERVMVKKAAMIIISLERLS
ncbi:MAG: hypothetical protein ABIS18_10605 [Actinomycetota bacterium]